MHDVDVEQRVRARADLVTAIVLILFGLALFYLSYTMPRLEARRIHPATIPGLVPMALGAALVVLGGMLSVHAWKSKGADGWGAFFAIFRTPEAMRSASALLLILIFAVGLVGWLPFWAASMIFIFVFVMTMETLVTLKPIHWGRSLLWAAITAVGAGGSIFYLFSNLLLVRLP